jgi:hypothetical protein
MRASQSKQGTLWEQGRGLLVFLLCMRLGRGISCKCSLRRSVRADTTARQQGGEEAEEAAPRLHGVPRLQGITEKVN